MQLISEGKVISNYSICKNIFCLKIAGEYKGLPGQFFMIKCGELYPMLWRPISISSIHKDSINFIYRMQGKGTEVLSKLKSGDSVTLNGPLGNGFPVDIEGKRIAIVAGGIGLAPMIYLSKALKNNKIHIYGGFKDEIFLIDEMKNSCGCITIASEEGKCENEGFITDFFNPSDYDRVYCCGPEIMMKKIVKICSENNVPVYVSMEKHMACGIGACLVCTCSTKNGKKRVCKDGPVFLGSEVIWDE